MHWHHIALILVLIVEHIDEIYLQSMPISPCPRIFQYRYDGSEWYGMVSVWKYQLSRILHVKVTLSLRGKPATKYLGGIELLTRDDFSNDAPVIYKIKFPKGNFPPKLMQVSVNDDIACIGSPDQSILTTQITLEHTRKLKFPLNLESFPSPTTSPLTKISTTTSFTGMVADAPANDAAELPIVITEQSSSPLRLSEFKGISNRSFKTKLQFLVKTDEDIFQINPIGCGLIDKRMSHQVLDAMVHENDEVTSSHLHDVTNDVRSLDPTPFSAFFNNSGLKIHSRDDLKNATHDFQPIFASSSLIFNSDTSFSNENLPSIIRGAWPWLAAIYVNNLTSLKYQCGGTLISTRIVVSAAHCFQLFKERYTANEVLIFLGRHNLKNWNEEESLASPVDDIYIHPEYNMHLNTYDADIAILVLKYEIKFNTFIRPACLWSGSTKLEYIIGEMGVVVGWNLNGNTSRNGPSSKPLTVPKIINTPIVSNEDCFRANIWYRSLSSNRTFCAGTLYTHHHHHHNDHSQIKTQHRPCTGDSGSGLLLYKNHRWMLRGIVSGAIFKFSNQQNEYLNNAETSTHGGGRIQNAVYHSSPSDGHKANSRKPRIANTATKINDGYINCNIDEYIIYTDVAQFLDWIYAFII